MKAGQLRHQVEIQANTPTQGVLGAMVDAWKTRATRWARVEPLSGKRLQYAQQIKAEVTHVVTMRYRDAIADLSHKDRLLLYGERVLTIDAVIVPEEWSDRIEVYCHEVRE
jgi:SPP1 family predicted phage head-tail adaptor